MKTYNKSEIMKTAWAFQRAISKVTKKWSFSECLELAWEKAKKNMIIINDKNNILLSELKEMIEMDEYQLSNNWSDFGIYLKNKKGQNFHYSYQNRISYRTIGFPVSNIHDIDLILADDKNEYGKLNLLNY